MLSHYRYFNKKFAEMFVEWFSIKHIIFDQSSQFEWLVAIRGIKLKLCRIVYNISLYKKDYFLLLLLKYFGSPLLWQLQISMDL